MPPKKRGRPVGQSSTGVPAKRVRVGSTSIIGGASDVETTASGRPKREATGDPNYGNNRQYRSVADQTSSPAKPSTVVKKRGRPAKNGIDSQVPAPPAANSPRKRGRPAKKVLAPAPAVQVPRKADRPPKSSSVAQKASATKASTTALLKAKSPGRPKKKESKRGKFAKGKQDGLTSTSKAKAATAKKFVQAQSGEDTDVSDSGRQYWLMKAEPDSRIEKGVDVKFSIDDLQKVESADWDGVRSYSARNNMRAMRLGDVAFFYHSNCKVPGIVGIMNIVAEHSVDETAFDPDHPYFDEKSSPDNHRWDIVQVSYRRKFAEMIKLPQLRSFGERGGALENMQLLKQARLSVSAVSRKEWYFIMGLAGESDGQEEADESEEQDEETSDSKVDDTLVDNANNGIKGILKNGNPSAAPVDGEGTADEEGSVEEEDSDDEEGDPEADGEAEESGSGTGSGEEESGSAEEEEAEEVSGDIAADADGENGQAREQPSIFGREQPSIFG